MQANNQRNLVVVMLVVFLLGGVIIGVIIGQQNAKQRYLDYIEEREEIFTRYCICPDTLYSDQLEVNLNEFQENN